MSRCPICSSQKLEYLGKIDDFYKSGKKCNLYKCIKCSVMFYDPFPKENYAQAFRDRIKKYYIEYDVGLQFMSSLMYPIKNKTFNNVLEIGAGFGFLLDIVNKNIKAKELFAIEPSDNIQFISKYFKIKNCIQDFFPSQQLNKQKFDLIISSEVIEHTFNPYEFINNISKSLSDDGIAIITTPNAEELYKSIKDKNYYAEDLFPGAHTILLNKAIFQNYFNELGLFYKIFTSEGKHNNSRLIIYFSKNNKIIKNIEYKYPTSSEVGEFYKKYLQKSLSNIHKDLKYSYIFKLVEYYVNTDPLKEKKELEKLFYAMDYYLKKEYNIIIDDLYTNYNDILTVEEYISKFPAFISRYFYYYGMFMLNIKADYKVAKKFFMLSLKMFLNELRFSEFQANEEFINLAIKHIEIASEYELSSQLSDRERVIEEQSSRIDELSSQLSDIYSSNGYKFLLKYYRIRDNTSLKHFVNFIKNISIKTKYILDIGSKKLGKTYKIQEFRKIDNKVCLFSHFDKDNIIDDYVINYLKKIKEIGFNIVFISTSLLDKKEVFKLQNLCNVVIIKENIGRDFGAWASGIKYLNEKNFNIKKVLLCNDSIYFPLFEINSMFKKMENKNIDMWGITDSFERNYHIQSYFLVFNEKILKSKFWKRFWKDFKIYKDKNKIINKYEIGITQKAIKYGFRVEAYCNYNRVVSFINNNIKNFYYSHLIANGVVTNPTHFLWDILITEFNCPILKVELIRDNPGNVYNINSFKEILNKYTSYDVRLIERHIKRVKI